MECIRESEKEFARKLFESKKEALEKEREVEEKHYAETGLYSNRDLEEIDDEMKAVQWVLNNIDNLPRCDSDGEKK